MPPLSKNIRARIIDGSNAYLFGNADQLETPRSSQIYRTNHSPEQSSRDVVPDSETPPLRRGTSDETYTAIAVTERNIGSPAGNGFKQLKSPPSFQICSKKPPIVLQSTDAILSYGKRPLNSASAVDYHKLRSTRSDLPSRQQQSISIQDGRNCKSAEQKGSTIHRQNSDAVEGSNPYLAFSHAPNRAMTGASSAP